MLREKDGCWLLVSDNGDYKKFDEDGRFIEEGDKNGAKIKLMYDGSGKLEKVLADNGTYIRFNYNEDALLSNIEDHTGRKVSYKYDANKKLFSDSWQESILTVQRNLLIMRRI